MGWDGQRHYSPPPDPGVFGTQVKITPDDDPEHPEYFWFYAQREGFDTWDEWWAYVGAMLIDRDYGWELA